MAWSPYLLLVVFVLLWGDADVKPKINHFADSLLPGFLPTVPETARLRDAPHGPRPAQPDHADPAGDEGAGAVRRAVRAELAERVGHGVPARRHRDGAACCASSPKQFVNTYVATFKQLKLAILTIASMLGLAYLMNYSGMTSTLGCRSPSTGRAFPFFSAFVGWLGVFLTGSDTSANALFGNLQVVTARALDLNPMLTASVNSAAGVMGKMISVQSIAVAVAATGMSRADESRLFRFTIKHSILLMLLMAIVSMLYAYVFPQARPRRAVAHKGSVPVIQKTGLLYESFTSRHVVDQSVDTL